MTNVTRTAKAITQEGIALRKNYGAAVPIISIEHPDMIEHRPGVVVEAFPDVAARMIVKRTHRVATEDEYQTFKDEMRERTDELRRLELEKKGVTTTVTPVDVRRPRKPVTDTTIKGENNDGRT